MFADVCQRRHTHEGLKEKQAATPSVSGTFFPLHFIHIQQKTFLNHPLLSASFISTVSNKKHSLQTWLSTKNIAPKNLI